MKHLIDTMEHAIDRLNQLKINLDEVQIYSKTDTRNGIDVVYWLDNPNATEDDYTIYISNPKLRSHIEHWGLNDIVDFPEYGDIKTVPLEQWLEDNQEYAIKHYILNYKP